MILKIAIDFQRRLAQTQVPTESVACPTDTLRNKD